MPGNSVNIQFLPIQNESRKAVINTAALLMIEAFCQCKEHLDSL